jgi:hypothetical protein
MPYNTKAPAQRLLTMIQGLGVSSVQLGVPESWNTTLCAYIGLGSQVVVRKATKVTGRDARYFVCFGYRVDGAETTAEQALMDLVDAFLAALYADLTLAGTCEGMEVDTGLADAPEYKIYTGKEFREYPIIVTCRQYGTFA